jgi:hypothetical protein
MEAAERMKAMRERPVTIRRERIGRTIGRLDDRAVPLRFQQQLLSAASS